MKKKEEEEKRNIPVQGGTPLTYKSSGVDIDKAEEIKEGIKSIVRRTLKKNVLFDVGPFSAGVEFGGKVLLATCDGVGTKTKLAVEFGKPEGLGYDLVAMNVNDVLAMHGKPIFFLDYIGMNNLRKEVVLKIVESVANACQDAECSLIGGETAEMPGFYSKDSIELVGFCVGEAEKEKLPKPEEIKRGDVLLAFPSTGPHSNGYSLIRKLISDGKLNPNQKLNGEKKLLDVLLFPTKIYVKDFFYICENFAFPKASAHITGGGIPENLSRIIPDGKKAVINKKKIREISEKFSFGVFSMILRYVDEREMFRVFNMGVGFIMVFPEETAREVVERSEKPIFEIGYIEDGEDKHMGKVILSE